MRITCERYTIDKKYVLNTDRQSWSTNRLVTEMYFVLSFSVPKLTSHGIFGSIFDFVRLTMAFSIYFQRATTGGIPTRTTISSHVQLQSASVVALYHTMRQVKLFRILTNSIFVVYVKIWSSLTLSLNWQIFYINCHVIVSLLNALRTSTFGPMIIEITFSTSQMPNPKLLQGREAIAGKSYSSRHYMTTLDET